MKTAAVNHAAVVPFRSLPKYTIRNDTKESRYALVCYRYRESGDGCHVFIWERVYIVLDSSREDERFINVLWRMRGIPGKLLQRCCCCEPARALSFCCESCSFFKKTLSSQPSGLPGYRTKLALEKVSKAVWERERVCILFVSVCVLPQWNQRALKVFPFEPFPACLSARLISSD